MTDLLAAAKRLGEARRGRAQSWLMSRYEAKTDNYATAVADEQWALEISLAEAEYLLAAREMEKHSAVEPHAPSAHAHAEGDHCDQTA